jgi:hypothetical protein
MMRLNACCIWGVCVGYHICIHLDSDQMKRSFGFAASDFVTSVTARAGNRRFGVVKRPVRPYKSPIQNGF